MFIKLYIPVIDGAITHDFNTITVAKAEQCFIAPDGVTIIPKVYDLARATCLAKAFPASLHILQMNMINAR